NWVRVAYDDSAQNWTITDSIGRTHKIQFSLMPYDGQSRPMIVWMELAAFDGSPARWDFAYVDGTLGTSIWRDCQSSHGPSQDELVAAVLQSVTRPDGTQWLFDHYDEEPGAPGFSCRQSELREVTLPTGGKIRYDYALTALPANDPCPGDTEDLVYVPAVVSRTLVDPVVTNPAQPDATWTYAYMLSN